MDLICFNSTAEEIEQTKNSIFIGISVGTKPMPEALVRQYITWCVFRAKESVKILIADEIEQFNILVFSHSTRPGALSRAIRDGDKHAQFLEAVLRSLPHRIAAAVEIVRWRDIVCDRYAQQLSILEEEFSSDLTFRSKLLQFIEKIARRRGRDLPEEKKTFLCKYLIHELPTLLDGIHHKGINHDLVFYPTYERSGMSEFVMDIQRGTSFPRLAEKLGLRRRSIMVEALMGNSAVEASDAFELTATR